MNSTPKPYPLTIIQPSTSYSLIEKTIFGQFKTKYSIDSNFYNSRIINDIVFNGKSHIVSAFKNHLILDDESEFLKRYYTMKESDTRLEKFYNFYETFSKIYPNYTNLSESKFIYKNIHKKQKMIDLQQKQDQSDKKAERTASNDKKANEVFSTDVYNSIVNDNDDIGLIFDLKNDNNDISNDNIEKLIHNIVLLLQFDEERLNLNHKNICNNNNSNCNNNSNSIDHYFKKNVMTPRVASYYPSKIMNRLIPNKHESAKILSKENNSNNTQIAIMNESQKNIFKHIRNEKSKMSNSSLSSAQRKNNLSTTLSHKKQQAPSKNNNNNKSNNANNANYIKFNPVSCCEDETNFINNRDSNNNSCTKQCNNQNSKRKVNIHSIKGSETMRLKKNILSHIHDSHNQYLLQSICQINPAGIQLGSKNSKPCFSPKITKRNGNLECKSLKDVLHNNTVNNSKASLSRTKAVRRIGHYSNIIKLIGKNEYMKKKLSYHCNKSNKIRQSPGNRNEVGMNTTRPKSKCKVNQLNYVNQNGKQINCNTHLEENKEIASCNIVIGQPLENNISIKQIFKGIQIKNFNKALGLNNDTNNNIETPLRKICTDRIRNTKKELNI